jgi:hypothetical protein
MDMAKQLEGVWSVDIRGFYASGGGKRNFTWALTARRYGSSFTADMEENFRRHPSYSLRLKIEVGGSKV